MDILNKILTQKNKIPIKHETWPEAWKTIVYKIYQRGATFHRKDSDHKPKGEVSDLLLTRRSSNKFSGKPLGLEKVLTLLRFSAGTQAPDSTHRTYASGGGLYPIEIYYINTIGTDSFHRGLYHFNPKDSSFSFIKNIKDEPVLSLVGSSYEMLDHASGIICFTAVPGRVTDKYGWLGIRLCFFDIGQIIQNVSLVAESFGLSYRPIAGFNSEKVDELIQIDGQTEMTLLVYALGA